MSIMRPEYPRPGLVRDSWINLNGEWEYTFDHGKSGRQRGLQEAASFDGRINVPFCPESKLSGVRYVDFINSIWYRRTFTLPNEWKNKRIVLHFGAVDYSAEAWVNGKSVGTHEGGYSSFAFEVTDALVPGENTLILCADDDTRSQLQPVGKQSGWYHSAGCSYTRTTGIWQTVWMEAVPKTYIEKIKITPDLENARVNILATINGPADGMELSGKAALDGEQVGKSCAKVSAGTANISIDIAPDQVKAWAPGSPTLYDLDLSLVSGTDVVDSITSYFGLRSLGMRGPALLLNGKPLFQRLILDQGFYPDGVYTAPSDEELKADIERSMAMGFNGARLHEKVFEERFLYWADRLGYIVWGEMANWGMDHGNGKAGMRFISEWIQVLERDYNHPSIVGWCPYNETWGGVYTDLLQLTYHVTKQIDPTRPVLDTSGGFHVGTSDVYDCHDYERDPAALAERFAPFAEGKEPPVYFQDKDAPYAGQPYFVSEYGGIWWNPEHADDDKSWGYGDRPKSVEEFITRYKGVTEVLLNHPRMCGFCYTQLTDVEQEVNGLYTYDRKAKFDPEIIKAINSAPAAIEKEDS